MTRVEMTEIFSLLMIAYPQAEMFRAESQQALKEKLAPVITLWTACLRDVDAWTAQMAVVKLCRTCKFPPSIAELREAADAVTKEVREEIDMAYLDVCTEINWRRDGEGLDEAYRRMSARSRKVIDAMGGMDAFLPPDGPLFNKQGFKQTYERLLRSNPIGLPDGGAGQKQFNG